MSVLSRPLEAALRMIISGRTLPHNFYTSKQTARSQLFRFPWQRLEQSSGASDGDDPGTAWPGLPAAASHPAKEALLPEQSPADGPPALDRFNVAGLPVVIAGEDGRARLKVEPERGFVPKDERWET